MNYLKDYSIRTLLLACFLVLAVLPLVTVGLLSYIKAGEVVEQSSNSYHEVILREMKKIVEFKIEEMEKISRILFPDPQLQGALRRVNRGYQEDYAEASDTILIEKILLSAVMSGKDIVSAAILAENGELFYADYSATHTWVGPDARQRKEILAGKGKPIWLPTDPELQVIPLARVMNDLETVSPLGILVLHIRESAIYELYSDLVADIETSLNGELFISGDDGLILSHRKKAFLGSSVASLYPDALELNAGSGTIFRNESKNYISWETIPGPSWFMVGIVPEEEYREQIMAIRNWIFLAAFILGVLAVTASLFLARWITGPLMELTRQMNRVKTGDFSFTHNYQGSNEIALLYDHFERMVREIDDLIRKVYQEELLLKQAELSALIMQINPHFLYNTLDSINWMARTKGVPKIGEMAKALGDLMRRTIQGQDRIPLREEMINIDNYLKIERFRYGDSISYSFSVPDELLEVEIPKLIIQPLVENAIIHGIEPSSRPGLIHIGAERWISGDDTEVLRVLVFDNGVGSGRTSSYVPGEGDRVGLYNVHQRLQLMYGPEYGVEVVSSTGEGTTAIIRMPIAFPGRE